MAGRRRQSLADILDQTDEAPTAAPGSTASVSTGPTSVPLDALAPNPLNARAVHSRPEKLEQLAASMRELGQTESCTVVTRTAFLAIFGEHAEATADAEYVQVSGGRRYVAAPMAGLAELDVVVRDRLAGSRAVFIAATLAENADHEDLDPIEEANQVAMLVAEVGTGQAAADQLGKTAGWVSQRLNLLRLVPEVQNALRSGEMPARQARGLHLQTPAEQLAALARWRRQVAVRERRAEQPVAERAAPAARAAASTVRWFGKAEPDEVAQSLRAGLPEERVRAIADAMLRSLDT